MCAGAAAEHASFSVARPSTAAIADATFGNDAGAKSVPCPPVCRCEHVVTNVCRISRQGDRSSYCDVRSAVGYAVHSSAFDAVLAWRNKALALAPSAERLGYFNDQWLPREVSPIHYVVPGVVTDSSNGDLKRGFVSRMTQFAEKCVVVRH